MGWIAYWAKQKNKFMSQKSTSRSQYEAQTDGRLQRNIKEMEEKPVFSAVQQEFWKENIEWKRSNS